MLMLRFLSLQYRQWVCRICHIFTQCIDDFAFSTVWIYLFFLPFQLIDQFLWYTIPGTTIAAFIYLGFLAAGEEIEQPFGV